MARKKAKTIGQKLANIRWAKATKADRARVADQCRKNVEKREARKRELAEGAGES